MAAAVTAASARPTLLDTLLEVDRAAGSAAQGPAARKAFEGIAREASTCRSGSRPASERARCVVDTLFPSDEFTAAEEPSHPDSSTVTSALVAHRGNCSAVSALALAVAEQAGIPLEAVVFPRHVVVRSPADRDHAFELLQRGAEMTMAQIQKRLGADGAHGVRVRAREFPTYYLDNLAVRFAEAGEADRADALFRQAIDSGPRVARVRFNYGTYLLGANHVEAARDQLERAVRLDSRNAPAWANLGVAAARLGGSSRARRCLERALRIEPGNRIASENLKALGPPGPPPPR